MSLEVRWLYCQELLDSVAGGSLGQIGFLNLLLEALSVKLKFRVQKTWSERQRCEMSCIVFFAFSAFDFWSVWHVFAFENVCTCIPSCFS